MAKEIPFDKDKIAIVDDEDFERVLRRRWILSRGYAKCRLSVNGRRSLVPMQNLVMRVGPGQEVDHKNQNKLDNQKDNLRICTQQQNSYNRRKESHSTQPYKGVRFTGRDCPAQRSKFWRARITVAGRRIHLGYFETAKEAARAYNEAAIKYHGEFACINELGDSSSEPIAQAMTLSCSSNATDGGTSPDEVAACLMNRSGGSHGSVGVVPAPKMG